MDLSHLVSALILALLEQGREIVTEDELRRMLYLAVKTAQRCPSLRLHDSLRNPECYGGLLEGERRELDRFLAGAHARGLVEAHGEGYRLSRAPRATPAGGEALPLEALGPFVRSVMVEAQAASAADLARLRFDDERLAYAWDRGRFSAPRYAAVNEQQTATESGEPFLLVPEGRCRPLGVVLAHGFLASPAETRPFAERLAALGYPVMGVRLKGHGTSPWDLRERRWEEWLASLERGIAIVSAFAPRVAAVGFSTGGTLALRAAAGTCERLAAVVGIAIALRFRNRNMALVPLVHRANRLLDWMPSYEGIMPFHVQQPEHPHINYRHVPVRGLYELRRLVDDVRGRLGAIRVPVLLLHGSADPVVEVDGAHLAYARLGSADKRLAIIQSERHGLLYEDIGDTRRTIVDYLAEHEARPSTADAASPEPS